MITQLHHRGQVQITLNALSQRILAGPRKISILQPRRSVDTKTWELPLACCLLGTTQPSQDQQEETVNIIPGIYGYPLERSDHFDDGLGAKIINPNIRALLNLKAPLLAVLSFKTVLRVV
jgi:hypothetical protein